MNRNKLTKTPDKLQELYASNPIVGWWSGGVTSAMACKVCIDLYGLDACRFVFIDTHNEDDDTYRFKKDCEEWYGKEIETISAIGDQFKNIKDIWIHYKTLNTATGAICSSTLKRDVRLKWEKENSYKRQAFGFTLDEAKRARSMSLNHKQAKPIFPLLMFGITKEQCIAILQKNNIEPPQAYKKGYLNNNCQKTLCIQGGIGYWQKAAKDDFAKWNQMADLEHYLTDMKGKPVTMLKDQSNGAKASGKFQVFLKPHPDYPDYKSLCDMKGRPTKPLMECNGFCGTNDLERNPTEEEINFDAEELR